MKQKASALVAIVFFVVALTSMGGLFSDDPISFDARAIPHMVGKDEIKFIPSGKCTNFMIMDVEVTLELTYSSAKKTLLASQSMLATTSPLTIALPDGLSGLQSYRLTGKFHHIWVFKEKRVPKNEADLEKNLKFVDGYKIDSKWFVK